MNSLHNWLNSLVIGGIVLVMLFGGHLAAPKAGNTTASFWDAALGYKVNGTTIVSSARALSNITTGSFSGAVGVASTSPFSTLGIGTSGTSTIAGQKFCAYFKDETGLTMWIKLNPTGASVFSTSTTPCT